MKHWKLTLLTTLGFFALSTMLVFNACVKDPCSELHCQQGTCSNGLCVCPAGWEGAECEIPASSRFVGFWSGNLRCDNFPITRELVTIELVEKPNTIRLKLPFGNTSVLKMDGIARTPETHFVTHVDDFVDIHAYVTVDADLIYVYLQTIDKQVTIRQICRFNGHKYLP